MWHKRIDEVRKSPFYAVLSGWDLEFKSLLLRSSLYRESAKIAGSRSFFLFRHD